MPEMFRKRRKAVIAAVAAIGISTMGLAGFAYADDMSDSQVDYALPLPHDALARDAYAQPHHDHPSVDLPVPLGTEAYASVAGQAEVFTDDSCGNGVQIVGADQAIYVYCHFDSHAIQSGPVEPGTLLGYTGTTGNSTGPHLHYQVKVADQLRCPQNQLLAIYDGVPPPLPGDLPADGCSYATSKDAKPMGPQG